VDLVERFIGKGFDVRVYEPAMASGKLHGTNLSFVEQSIPRIRSVGDPLDRLMLHAEVVVVMKTLRREEDLKCFQSHEVRPGL
jgi:GDP-mannose 6-dehydrogenase